VKLLRNPHQQLSTVPGLDDFVPVAAKHFGQQQQQLGIIIGNEHAGHVDAQGKAWTGVLVVVHP
jgi:hypothetical protein